MPVAVNGSKCFSYWTQLIGINASIQVSAVRYGNSIAAQNQTQVLSLFNTTTSIWTKVSVNIDPTVLNSAEFAMRIRGKINNPKNFIALDDIKLTDGVCDSTQDQVFCIGDETPLDISKVCNFVNDCALNEDELRCGACDFELGNSFLKCLFTIKSISN